MPPSGRLGNIIGRLEGDKQRPNDNSSRGNPNAGQVCKLCNLFTGKETLLGDPPLRVRMSKTEVSATMLRTSPETDGYFKPRTRTAVHGREGEVRTLCMASTVQLGSMLKNENTHFAHDSFSGNTTRCSAGGSLRTCAGGGIGFVTAMEVFGEAGLVTGQNKESAGMSRAAGVALRSMSSCSSAR